MSLLLLNAFKGLKKKKIQMTAIIVMVMLSTAIFTSMNTALDRLENRYYAYLDEQNVEDFSINPVINYDEDVSVDDINYLENNQLKNILSEEQVIISNYKKLLLNNQPIDYGLSLQVQNIFTKYNASKYIITRKLDAIKNKYDFSYDIESSKLYNYDKYLVKAFPYHSDKLVNKTYLFEGNYPVNDNEITVLPNFAKSNNLKIGDIYKVQDKEYKIVGYTYAPDYIYPLIAFSMPVFDEKYNNIMFMNQKTYDNFLGASEEVYSLKFNKDIGREIDFTKKGGVPTEINELLENEQKTLTIDANTITRLGRIKALQLEFATNRKFAEYFLYLLLGIAVFIIMVITKKRIDDERLQIGVLKSLGYSRFSIAVSYLVYPIIGSIIGGLIGYGLGLLLNGFLTNVYLSYFTVPLSGFKFDLKYLLASVLIPIVLLSLLSYLISIIMLRKKPLALLKEGSNLKVNFFSKLMNKVTAFLPFKYRFKYALASRSLGKLLIVSITSFATGMLIVLTLIGSNLFSSMIDKSFEGLTYDYMISLGSNIQFSDVSSEHDDYVLTLSSTLKEVRDKNDKLKTLNKDDYSITITGVDEKRKYIDIKDKKNKDLLSNIKDNEVIINANMQEVLGLEVGDKLVLGDEKMHFEFIVAGVSESYMNLSCYALRKNMSDQLQLPISAYNSIFSKDSKYNDLSSLDPTFAKNVVTILSIGDLKDNIMKKMDTFNGSVYFVIGFASLMALVIIAVIANIVVEENKKTISLMKVMGYKNKHISSIVLNIYTPFVIIAYLLSIPAMIWLLKKIVQSLVGDMDMIIPISLSPGMAILGLVGLLVAYYIAVSLSRKVLNKVPLAIALKRE